MNELHYGHKYPIWGKKEKNPTFSKSQFSLYRVLQARARPAPLKRLITGFMLIIHSVLFDVFYIVIILFNVLNRCINIYA